jgi:hypothetical protein
MKMKIPSSSLSALVSVAMSLLCACASTPQGDVERRPAEVKLYSMGQLADNRYEVVSRLWVDSWRSAFRIPTYPSEDEAIASLQAEAARLGADGLVNVSCLDQGRSTKSQNAEPTVLCYGIAVRVKRSDG